MVLVDDRFGDKTEVNIDLTINDDLVTVEVDPDESLLQVLREKLGLLGTKEACGRGECGACTVLVGGRPVLSCLLLASRTGAGERIETIEGVAVEAASYRKALADFGGFQCGYCTPGQVVRAVALLRDRLPEDDVTLRQAISGNICRCTGYLGILRALREAGEAPARSTEGDDE